MTFSVLNNGRVAIFSQNKRLLFEPGGALVVERYTETNDFFAESVGDNLYVYSTKGHTAHDHMVTILNDRLETVDHFHAYDDPIWRMPKNKLLKRKNATWRSSRCRVRCMTHRTAPRYLRLELFGPTTPDILSTTLNR